MRHQFHGIAKPNRIEWITQVNERRFLAFEAMLDKMAFGPMHLSHRAIMNEVKKQIHRYDGERYQIVAYTIMSNHVHLLMVTDIPIHVDDLLFDDQITLTPFCDIMQSIKGVSAREANKVLQRQGQFWQRESYDRYIRDEQHLANTIAYIANNLVKAGLCANW
jgi:REP element-mobilizing transposase RayT